MNRALALVNVTGLIVGISYGLHGPVLPVFAKNVVGATYSELGLIGFASFIPYMFVPILVGGLLDRFSNARLLAAGVALNSASVYLLSISHTVPEIAGLRVMTGVAHAFFWPPCESIIAGQSTEKNRVGNISRFTMFFVIGFMVGPLLGAAFLAESDAYRPLFQVTAFMMAAAMVAALGTGGGGARRGRFSLGSITKMGRFPEVVVLVVFCTASFGLVLTIYPAFLNDRGMSPVDVLLLYFVFGVSRTITLALAGRLAARTGPTLVAATASITMGLAVSVWAGSIVWFGVALALMGFGFSIFFPLTLEIILSRTSRAVSGRMIGAYEAVFGIGWAVGPTIGGPATMLADWAPYAMFCAAGACATALAYISRKKLEPAGATRFNSERGK